MQQQQDSDDSSDSHESNEEIQMAPPSTRSHQQQLLINEFMKNRSSSNKQNLQSETSQYQQKQVEKNLKPGFLNFKDIKGIMSSKGNKEQEIIALFSKFKNLKEAINNTERIHLIANYLIEIFNILAQSEENTNQFLQQMLESKAFINVLDQKLTKCLFTQYQFKQQWIDIFVNSLSLIQAKYNTVKELPIDLIYNFLSQPFLLQQYSESVQTLYFLKQAQQDQIIEEMKRKQEQAMLEQRKKQLLLQEKIKIDYQTCPCEPIFLDFKLTDHLDETQSFGQLISADQQFGYYSSDLYLNNNFYILREDYLRDFRNAVKHVMYYGLDKYEKSLNRNMYIYRSLYVDSIQFNFSGIIFLIQIIPISNKIINWPKSNRLRPGSLLLLTTEAFEEMYFAQVIQRKTEQKANSKDQPVELYIKLYNLEEKFKIPKFRQKYENELEEDELEDYEDEDEEEDEEEYNFRKETDFDIRKYRNLIKKQEANFSSFGEFVLKNYNKIIVFENKIYFEPYIHHLQCIQSKNSTQFPFQEQIILNNYQQQKPGYIKTSFAHYQINLNFNLNEEVKTIPFAGLSEKIDIFGKWDLKSKGSLDESQFEAVQSMLTQQISLIQGPPGTGKTYCGALGVKLLLENRKNQEVFEGRRRQFRLRRNVDHYPPILIVCHTNHALDQFLRHILTFVQPDDLVRVGGRCKDEELKQCVLKQRNLFFNFKQFHDLKEDLTFNLKNVLNYNQRIEWHKYMPKCCNIIVNQFLQFNKLQFEKPITFLSQNTIFYDWLIGSDIDDDGLINEITDIEKDKDNLLLSEIKQIETKKVKQNRKANRQKQNQNTFELLKQNSDDEEEEEDQHLEHSDSDDERDQVNNNQEIENQIDQQKKDKEKEQQEEAQEKQKEKIQEQNQQKETQQKEGIDQNALDCDKLYHLQLEQETDVWNCKLIQKDQLEDQIRLQYFNHIIGQANIVQDQNKFIQMIEEYNKKKEQSDLEQIADAKIVGVTVTGCAKYAKKLTQLGIQIIFIEEAAEVLESHTASILSESLQHLIMIGDHQQLKPKLESYYLEKKYRTNISLFERLVHNQFPYVTLSTQRRMKTKFSNIIRLIYGNTYLDHESIAEKNSQPILGLGSDLIFFNHSQPEDSEKQQSSKSNRFEAYMIVNLARYLIQNNYYPKQITILSMYVKQLLIIQKELIKLRFNQIKVQTVDNYQGEENDIIILSLVRSNKENKLGFVGIENRVCVALSRARIGLYVFGDFNFIYQSVNQKLMENKNKKYSQSTLWIDIIDYAKSEQFLNDTISIRCQSHGESNTIKYIQDWKKAPEGGCQKICNIRFECGHVCQSLCHVMEHSKKNCQGKCQSILECNHQCLYRCCDIPCPPCQTQVWKIIPDCLHQQLLICSQNPQRSLCTNPCQRTLICGHQCPLQCRADCIEAQCLVSIEVKLLHCEHKQVISCCDRDGLKSILCTEKCGQKLQCGHICEQNCSKCYIISHQCKLCIQPRQQLMFLDFTNHYYKSDLQMEIQKSINLKDMPFLRQYKDKFCNNKYNLQYNEVVIILKHLQLYQYAIKVAKPDKYSNIELILAYEVIVKMCIFSDSFYSDISNKDFYKRFKEVFYKIRFLRRSIIS